MTEQDKIRKFLEERSLSVDVGNDKQACSIASINLALGNGLTEDVPKTVSPVITHWLMLSQDIMSSEVRNTKLKEILPSLINTDNGQDKKRIKILRRWVFNNLAKRFEEEMDDIGVLIEYKRALRLKSKKSFHEVMNKLGSNMYAYSDLFELMIIIANNKDDIAVARKVGIIGGYGLSSKIDNTPNASDFGKPRHLDNELITLLNKLIKVK